MPPIAMQEIEILRIWLPNLWFQQEEMCFEQELTKRRVEMMMLKWVLEEDEIEEGDEDDSENLTCNFQIWRWKQEIEKKEKMKEKFQLQWKRRGEDRLLWAGFSLKWEVLGHLHANPDLKAICHKRSFCWKWAKWIQNWVSWAQTTWVKIQKSNAVTCSTQCTHNARKSENTHTRPKVPKLPRKS